MPEFHAFVLEGGILTGNSFPIKTRDDLKNAIHLVGHAKDPAKARAHICRRARALGATDLLPDDWKKDKALMSEAAEPATPPPATPPAPALVVLEVDAPLSPDALEAAYEKALAEMDPKDVLAALDVGGLVRERIDRARGKV